MKRHWDKKIFKDNERNNLFLRDGFITSNLLTQDEVEEILNYLHSFDTTKTPFFHSRIISDISIRKELTNKIHEFILNKIDRLELTEKYKIAGSVAVIKNKSQQSEFSTHTDDSLCDERYFMPFNLWIPLVDINTENGGLFLYKGSHIHTNPLRGRTIPDRYLNEQEFIKKEKAENPLIEAGDCIVYHPGCIHYSPPNNTDSPRYALVIACIPQVADKLVFILTKKFLFRKELRKYYIEDENFDYDSWDNYSVPDKIKSEIIPEY